MAIAVPAWFLGKLFPIVGGAVIAIIAGMVVALPLKDKSSFLPGIRFSSKKILQFAVILLGFGMNLGVVLETGRLMSAHYFMYDFHFLDSRFCAA